MDLDALLIPSETTSITVPLSYEQYVVVKNVKGGDIVLFSAGQGEDNHLAMRVRVLAGRILEGSKAAYLGIESEVRTGVRNLSSAPTGKIYINQDAREIYSRCKSINTRTP